MPSASTGSNQSQRDTTTTTTTTATDDPYLGFSAMYQVSGDEKCEYCYVSESIESILGYKPAELIGKSCYVLFHPDEAVLMRHRHYQTLQTDGTASVTYLRLLHRDGQYVSCAVSHSSVWDRSVGMITRAEHGPMTIQMSRTAREVIEFRYVDGNLEFFIWPKPSESYPHIQPPAAVRVDRSKLENPWVLPPDPTPRTYFCIDRFTDTSRVVYASNDIIVHCPTPEPEPEHEHEHEQQHKRGVRDAMFNQPFYSIIRPSDRGVVRQYIEAAKEMSPVKNDDRRPGGYLYARFHVLKIPDRPPKGEHYPQGTDESERLMPGQQFIPVEATFLAGSDGLMCVIERLGPPGTAEDPQRLPARDGTTQDCWERWADMADRNPKRRKELKDEE